MLSLSVLVVVAGVAAVASAVTINEQGFYDTRYNHFDVERILSNKRLVMYYGLCLLGKGACTPQGTEFKRILPEALRTNCVRCTEKQKVTAYQAIKRLKKEYPKIWQQLQAAWDPKGEYLSAFINSIEANTTPGAEEVSTGANNSNVVISRFGSDSDNEIEVPLATGIYPPALYPPTRTEETSSTSETTSTSTAETSPSTAETSPSTAETSSSTAEASPSSAETSSSTAETPPSTSEAIIPEILFNIEETSASAAEPSSSTTEATYIYTAPTFTRTSTVSWPNVPVIDTNYRNTYRPNRFNILLPKPQEIGRLTANVFESIGDIGNKVIRTGARIADIVLSGVHAGVQATIRIGRPTQ